METVYESVADLQFTHMASVLMRDKKGENLRHPQTKNLEQPRTP